MKGIRRAAGLSYRELADLLRVSSVDDLRQMERGKRRISGPIRLILEMIHDGRLKPADELTAVVGGD